VRDSEAGYDEGKGRCGRLRLAAGRGAISAPAMHASGTRLHTVDMTNRRRKEGGYSGLWALESRGEQMGWDRWMKGASLGCGPQQYLFVRCVTCVEGSSGPGQTDIQPTPQSGHGAGKDAPRPARLCHPKGVASPRTHHWAGSLTWEALRGSSARMLRGPRGGGGGG
jgi:hypothetical protein